MKASSRFGSSGPRKRPPSPEGRADDEAVGQREVGPDVVRRHAGADEDRHARVLLDAPQLRDRRRLGRAGAGHDHPVHEEELRLFDLVENVQVAGQRVGAMLLLHVAEDLDVLAAQLLALAQESARAAFDQPRPADVGEDVAFDAQEVEVGLVRDFQRGLVGGFEHLDADRPGEAAAHFRGDPLHHLDRARRQRRFDVGQVVAVLQHDGVHAGVEVMPQVGQGLRDDLLVIAAVARRAGQRQDGDHRAEEFVGQGSHVLGCVCSGNDCRKAG